ncbi:hypothetical protein GCM10011579_071950 [Streptomyces albiflavescens]|uniref:Uncharacterized protein n=1 Tax=Streptomyces albiflavescens TaxID=1623582 RepID=A0A917YBQ3_9ACTN|nr:hypothetical protein [Streptomyces albiflavescens]GGN83319.1 hypothetical protein GCM10011579_071950 [Streptomyces albiflavescens]
MNSAGAAISASSSQWTYTPYYNGVPAATSSYSSAGPVAGAPSAHAGTGLRPAAEPDLVPLKTDHRQ